MDWFGTDGIRGKAYQFPVTLEVAKALGAVLGRRTPTGGKVMVGRDPRNSGKAFEDALVEGLCEGGEQLQVERLGILPTPGVVHRMLQKQGHWGIMISASHNPWADNGLKVFHGQGRKGNDEEGRLWQKEMESYLASPWKSLVKGSFSYPMEAWKEYGTHLLKNFPLDLTGIKIVLDTAHGAASEVGPWLFRAMGAQVFCLGNQPLGRNINDDCGVLAPENAKNLVQSFRAHLGLVLDGDGDRLVAIDDAGEVLDGDELLALLAKDLWERGDLQGGAIVATVVSNGGLEASLAPLGIGVWRSPVGDRHVAHWLQEKKLIFGGESSGHLLYGNLSATADGLLGALQLLSYFQRKNQPLSQLRSFYKKMPQLDRNLKIVQKKPLADLPVLQEYVHRFEKELGHSGRILLRYSGTEPFLRLTLQGPEENQLHIMMEALISQAQRDLL